MAPQRLSTPARLCGLAGPLLALLAAGPARAELTSASPTTFVSVFRQEIQATPARAIEAVGRPDLWWNPAHSYSGQAQNLRLGLRAGDCFCETWEGGSVEHARVVNVQAGRLVRLEGALGPLQDLAVRGVLSFGVTVTEGRTWATLSYRVAGAPEAGLEQLAPVVDRVIGEQFRRWTAFADRP